MIIRNPRLSGAWRELRTVTAQEIMTANPRSIHDSASLRQAAEFLCEAGVSGAPVIDDAGRPVGVVTRTDLLRHAGYDLDAQPVRRAMTRAVFSVWVNTPAAKVLAKLIALQVRRLFVVDDLGVLVGVISAADLLRHLAWEREVPESLDEVEAEVVLPALVS